MKKLLKSATFPIMYEVFQTHDTDVPRSNAADVSSRAKSFAARDTAPVQMEGEKSKRSMAGSYARLGGIAGFFGAPAYSSFQNQQPGAEPDSFGRQGLLSLGGAFVGSLLGGAYGYYQGYDTYSDIYSVEHYQNELQAYLNWQEELDDGLSAYESGVIFEYNDDNAATIHGMLNVGKIMYAYDVTDRLRVSGKHGPIKHAILSENRDVYSAGSAWLVSPPAKRNLELAIETKKYLGHCEQKANEYAKFGTDDDYYIKAALEVEKVRKELEDLGRDPDTPLQDLIAEHQDFTIEKQGSTLHVDNDSGHFQPGYSAGHAAIEAWNKKAGYQHVSWKPFKKKTPGLLREKVKDVE